MYLSADSMRTRREAQVIRKDGQIDVVPTITETTEERWDFIEGSAFNLTLGEVKVIDPQSDELEAFIGVEKRYTPVVMDIPSHPISARGEALLGWRLQPYGWFLLVSQETINVATDMFMPVKPRFSFASSFAAMTCSDAHPNYQGKITTLLQTGPIPLILERGAEFCFVRMAMLDSQHSDAYRGIWGVEGHSSTTGGAAVRAK
jgi:deoxycytidine triphosphate deaminase